MIYAKQIMINTNYDIKHIPLSHIIKVLFLTG